MIQRAQELLDRLVQDFPNCVPELVTFPSGAFMLYATAAGEEWGMEYLPSFSVFGVSKVSNATFGWEGVENAFDKFEAAETFLRDLFPK
jgi:hypothetical protein